PPPHQHAKARYRADPKALAIALGTAPPRSTSLGFAGRLHERRQVDLIPGIVQRKHAGIESLVFDLGYIDPPDSAGSKSSDFDFRHRRVHPEIAPSISLGVSRNAGIGCGVRFDPARHRRLRSGS